MPLIARVEGRDSDLLTVQTDSGVREISAGLVQVAVETLLDVREYQLVQMDDNRVRVSLEPLPEATFDLEKANQVVGDQLRANGIDAQRSIELEVVKELARPDDSKFKRVVQADEVAERKAS